MDESCQTRTTLIFRLQEEQDEEAWAEFVEIYTPVIYRLLKGQGLQDADACDVTQEVFRTVVRSIRGFKCHPSGGSFRGWLYTITRSRLSDYYAKHGRQVVGTGNTAFNKRLSAEPDPVQCEEEYEREYRASLFRWAARQVQQQFTNGSWEAFWRTKVEGQRVREAARALSMSEGAVYIARSRVLARLREKIEEIEDK